MRGRVGETIEKNLTTKKPQKKQFQATLDGIPETPERTQGLLKLKVSRLEVFFSRGESQGSFASFMRPEKRLYCIEPGQRIRCQCTMTVGQPTFPNKEGYSLDPMNTEVL